MAFTDEGLAGEIELLVVLEVLDGYDRERVQHILIHYILLHLLNRILAITELCLAST